MVSKPFECRLSFLTSAADVDDVVSTLTSRSISVSRAASSSTSRLWIRTFIRSSLWVAYVRYEPSQLRTVANQRLRSIPRLSLYESFASAGSQYSCSRPSGRPSPSQKLVRAFPDAGLSLWRVVLWIFGHDSAPANGATRMLAWRSVSLLLPPPAGWERFGFVATGCVDPVGPTVAGYDWPDWLEVAGREYRRLGMVWGGHSFRWMRVGASVSSAAMAVKLIECPDEIVVGQHPSHFPAQNCSLEVTRYRSEGTQ